MDKDMILAKTYNLAFNSRLNEFIYLTLLSLLLCFLASFIEDGTVALFIFLEFMGLILALTTKRLSDTMIYSTITKHLSMNLKNLDYGVSYDYDVEGDRVQLAEKFKSDFLFALRIANKMDYKKIKLTTHKWVIENVIENEDVKSFYDIKVVEKGDCKTTLETLLLAGKHTDRKNYKKKQYEVTMTKKTNK